MKAAPAYMSFDDVDVEADDDSDGELFVEDSRDNRGSGASRSPGSIAAQASSSSKSASAYTINAPSVYRAPSLAPPASAAPAAPDSNDAPARVPEDEEGYSAAAAAAGGDEGDGSSGVPVAAPATAKENMSSHQAIAGSSSAELMSSGSGLRGGLAGGLRLGGGEQRVMSIPRDGSMLESARPHGQSESFHGYKGYPGYEPDTPVAQQLTQPGRAHATDALTINPGADVADPRQRHAGAAGPTPSSVRYQSREIEVTSEMGVGSTMTPVAREEQQQQHYQQYQQEQALGMDIDGGDGYVEEQQQQQQQQSRQQRRQHRQQQQQQQPVISPSGTTSMEMATGLRPPEPRGRAAQVEVSG
ncbi:unnamed protein product [Ectocarpus fasciculatus]